MFCRKWVFREVNITKNEFQELQKSTIADLVHPRQTILDESLGTALWFAARGRDDSGVSPCRVCCFIIFLLYPKGHYKGSKFNFSPLVINVIYIYVSTLLSISRRPFYLNSLKYFLMTIFLF